VLNRLGTSPFSERRPPSLCGVETMLATHRGSWTLAAPVALAAGAIALGCSERARPGRIADPRDGAERSLSGSFMPPPPGASAGAGGVVPPVLDGGLAEPGSGGAAGDAGSAASGSAALQQVYEGSCDGSTVQWGFFTFEAATPGDSSIIFRLRTAASEDELASGTFIELLTASTALGTDRCGFTGPAPCPIDLYEVLGGAPLAHHPFAQLAVLLSPTSDDGSMPSVKEWQLTYSCTFDQ
jgi:hypothetical protein